MKAISIKQPFASLIAHGIKDVENRSWKCPDQYIGQRVLIHASGMPLSYNSFYDSVLTHKQLLSLPPNKDWADFNFCVGAIIGSVVIAGCVKDYQSVWAIQGCWHWILKDAVLFENPIEGVKGKLRFWNFNQM